MLNDATTQFLSILCHLISSFPDMFLIGNLENENIVHFFRENGNQEFLLQHFIGKEETEIPSHNIGKWETGIFWETFLIVEFSYIWQFAN